MRLKLGLGVLLLVFLVAFSCTTKKPTKFDEFTVFRGKVVDSAGQPVKDALVELDWFRGENCVCKPGNIIECAVLDALFTDQPTNAKGEYSMEIDWDALGFLFDESSPCQMGFLLRLFSEPDYDSAVAVDTVYVSSQDRSVPQVVNFQIP
jgi:hypothetical protein